MSAHPPAEGDCQVRLEIGKVGARLMSGGAGEAVLMYSRFMAVVYSQPTWDVVTGLCTGEGLNGNRLSAEEELMVMGLLLEH